MTAIADWDDHTTRVLFRRWPDGDITAILLDLPANGGYVMTYTHVGQHSEGRYHELITGTLRALPEQYWSLLQELQGIGYRLKVRSRKAGGHRTRGRVQ